MVNNVNANAVCQSDRFQARAVVFKELTGREVVIEKDENGDFVHLLHPESTQRLGFMIDFFRVGFSSSDGFGAAIENLSRRYAEIRDELSKKYEGNQGELYARLGELNSAFESALHSMALLPLAPPPTSSVVSSNMPQSIRDSIEQQWQEFEDANRHRQTLKQNMARHLDNFFEVFIKSIQNTDFDTAFANGMEGLGSGER